jgi:nucleotidyltransferase substrate binding protein (TIGR01987 family)
MDKKILELKLKDFEKALKTLGEALKKNKDDIVRDSVIKRFEYCFELGWKTSKTYLKEVCGLDIFSPKEVFRQLRVQELLNDKETELALKMVNSRNSAVHIYQEKIADELYLEIEEKYFELLRKILKNIKS